ncbi:putative baseplate assembly protein [Streptomyces griseoviridis]|uniref:putative baseplate assembly protein n=1 Tax=Streptomyces TaxID=1883 RepID=UPI002475E7F5|nr:putative baseplate assembly protein [Streptomyces sp. MAA16]MDH6699532.1 putative phage baseplate assembly protein [Streptomyces sp. MAA16]
MSLPTPEYDPRGRDDLLRAAVAAVRGHHGTMSAWQGRDRADPGRALLESCLDMALVLGDRLNRAADRHRLDLLSRLGPRPCPAVAARGEVVFTLAAPAPEPVRINAGVEVATRPPADDEETVVFSTVTDAVVNPCVLVVAGNYTGGYQGGRHRGTLTRFDDPEVSAVEPGGLPFAGPAFHLNLPYTGDFPLTDDAAPVLSSWGGERSVAEAYPLVVLSNPVPGVRLTLDVDVVVLPREWSPVSEPPPITWRAWAGTRWEPCPVITTARRRDGTQRVTLDLPAVHAPADLLLDPFPDLADGRPWRLRDVGLLRAESPQVRISSVTLNPVLNVTVPVVQARRVTDEELGIAAGVPGERLRPAHRPLLLRSADGLTVEATAPDGSRLRWRYVQSLDDSTPEDRHFAFHPRTGEAVFAPVVPEGHGAQRYGAPLPAGARLRLPLYLTGGGARGNVPARTVTALRTPLPYVSDVNNPAATTGGTDQETPGRYAVRRPLGSTVPERAVAAADYRELALAASAGMARIHHVPTEAADSVRINPARNFRDWTPARTTVSFLLSAGVTVGAGTVVETTEEPKGAAFVTDEDASAQVPQAEAGSLRLRGPASAVGGMFTGGTWRGAGALPGNDTIGAGDGPPLVMALVRVPAGVPLDRLDLWVSRSPGLAPGQPLPISVFLPRAAAPWWDTDMPCCYAAPTETTTEDGVTGHRVPLSGSRDWRLAVSPAHQAYATTVYEALGEQPAGFPEERSGAWLAVQIRDPHGPSGEVGYTVRLSAGMSAPVRATQTRTMTPHPETSDGDEGQYFDLLVPGGVLKEFPTLRVKEPGAERAAWSWVDDFRGSGPEDPHAVLDASTGRVYFGPFVPGPSGGGTQHGKVPPAGAEITVDPYRVTLGAAGNQVTAGTPCALPQPQPGVDSACVADDAAGGVDGYTDTSGGSTEFGVQLLVVPRVTPDRRGWFPYQDLMPTADACQAVRQALAPRQPAGVPVWLRPPAYRGLRITATIAPADFLSAAEREELRTAAERALYTYFSPVTGGPDGTGWPFGRPVHVGEAFQVLDRVPGVGQIREVRLAAADPETGLPQPPEEPVVCSPGETVYSVEHRITVTDTP